MLTRWTAGARQLARAAMGAVGVAGSVTQYAVAGTVGAATELAHVAASAIAGEPWHAAGRAHLPVRGLCGDEAAALERRLRARDGVERAEVNGALGEVMVAYDCDRLTAREVAALVRAAAPYGVGGGNSTVARPRLERDHPLAAGPLLRDTAFLGLHLTGFATTSVLRAVPLPAPPLLTASVLGLAEAAPRVREQIAAVTGEAVADVVLGAAAAMSNTLTRRPVGLLADAARRWCDVEEGLARRRAWASWDDRLEDLPGAYRCPPPARPPRARPLPPGPVERTAETSSALTLIGATGLLAIPGTRDRGVGVLAAGIPKAAGAGRDGFAAQLDRDLADAGVLVLEPGALRRLDRVDTVVIDAAALMADRPAGTGARRGSPPGEGTLDPLAEAVIAAARDAGRVLLAGAPDGLAGRLRIDDTGAGHPTKDVVRALQRDGHVVATVDACATSGATSADVALTIVRPGRVPRWSAHVLVGDLAAAHRLLAAVGDARRVSHRSAQLSAVGSVVGGALAVIGPSSGVLDRAVLPAHAAALAAVGYGRWSAASLARRPPPVPTDSTAWHAMSRRGVLDALGTSRAGLAPDEAARRRASRTAPEEQEVGLVRATIDELATPLTPALATGAGVSAVTGSPLDAGVIMGVLALDALIGGAQQVGAQRAVRALRSVSATPVPTRRAGTLCPVPASDLVPGDVIALHAGDAVPADCRLLTEHDLETDESSLTGESVSVSKSVRATEARDVADRRSMLYEGTVVAAGRAEAVVVATGEHTEGGQAMRRQEAPPPTGVEQRLRSLMARALPLSLGAGVAVVAVDLLRGRGLRAALGPAVGLAVAAVPEGLPVVATMAELAAAGRLSRRGALVRRPSTIEALGRVDVLCFDKTGTLTEGRIALRLVSDGVDTRAVTGPVPEPLRAVVAAAQRASPFHLEADEVTHQTDRAVLRAARELGLPPAFGHARLEYLAELPFASGRGYHATLWRGASATHLSVKGAPEVVLPLCTRWRRTDGSRPMDACAREQIVAEVHRLAARGHRVLAVAENDLPGATDVGEDHVRDLELRGLVALVDPIRPTAARALATLRAAGVAVTMITGDHPSTARSIAGELGLVDGRGVLTGTELDDLDDDELVDVLPHTAVFARVSPAHKARIVRLLHRADATVAVTGDGTNDAPAIRLADVGIALGSRATPAAREAADVVVTDDRIETITDALVEGRAMWLSVRDALSILVGGNLGEIAYTLTTGLLTGTTALNARQLLLVNLLTDVLPAMALAVRPPGGISGEQLLAEGPEGSLGASLDRDIATRAVTTAASAGAAWLLALPLGTPGQTSTTGLVALVAAQLGQTLAARGRSGTVVLAVVGSLVVLGAAVQTPGLSRVVGCRPLLPHHWAIALASAATSTAVQAAVDRVLGRTATCAEAETINADAEVRG